MPITDTEQVCDDAVTSCKKMKARMNNFKHGAGEAKGNYTIFTETTNYLNAGQSNQAQTQSATVFYKSSALENLTAVRHST